MSIRIVIVTICVVNDPLGRAPVGSNPLVGSDRIGNPPIGSGIMHNLGSTGAVMTLSVSVP